MTGVDMLTTEKKLLNPEHYKYVKFFVCDVLERGVSHTKSYKLDAGGMTILVR